jgi:hypothetical protein
MNNDNNNNDNNNIQQQPNNNILENKKNSRKGSKKSYITTPEKKAEYLDTYKNKPCYNLLVKCPICNVEYIKASEQMHLKSKKHILNKEAYDITFKQVKQDNIINEDEQIKLFNENKFKIKHEKYLESLKIKNPSYYENYKLFV